MQRGKEWERREKMIEKRRNKQLRAEQGGQV